MLMNLIVCFAIAHCIFLMNVVGIIKTNPVSRIAPVSYTHLVSTGDAGLYGMAGPILELATDIEVEIIPGCLLYTSI